MRIARVTREEMSPEQRTYYDAMVNGPFADKGLDRDGSLLGPALVWIQRPDLGAGSHPLSGALMFARQLSGRASEIVILVTAQAWGAEFIWYAHTRSGRREGLTDAEILALHEGCPPALSDPVEVACYEMARALVTNRDLDDAEYAKASAALSTGQMVEVTTLVGHYSTHALNLRVFRVGLPLDAVPAFS